MGYKQRLWSVYEQMELITLGKGSQKEETNALNGVKKNEWCGYQSRIWSNIKTKLKPCLFSFGALIKQRAPITPQRSECPKMSAKRINNGLTSQELCQN